MWFSLVMWSFRWAECPSRGTGNLGLLFAIPRLRTSQPCGWNMHLDARAGVPRPIWVCASCRQLCSIRLSWDSFQLKHLGARSYWHYLSNASTVLGTSTQNRALCVLLIWLKNDHVVLWADLLTRLQQCLCRRNYSGALVFGQCMEQNIGLDT